MEIVELDEKLRSLSDENSRQSWSLLDTAGHPTYGLNFAKIAQIAREVGKDSCLADELYASGNHDLQVLATYLDDSDSYTRDDLRRRAHQLYLSPFAEKFCKLVLAKSRHAVEFIDEWMAGDNETLHCYAFYALEALAGRKNNLSVDFYARYVAEITLNIQGKPDAVKEAMHEALVAIGCRDASLQKRATKAIQKMGEITFNNGNRLDCLELFEKRLQAKKLVRG